MWQEEIKYLQEYNKFVDELNNNKEFVKLIKKFLNKHYVIMNGFKQNNYNTKISQEHNKFIDTLNQIIKD